MGVFDIIEMENHICSINEYLLYIDSHRDEYDICSNYISGHLLQMKKILEKMK